MDKANAAVIVFKSAFDAVAFGPVRKSSDRSKFTAYSENWTAIGVFRFSPVTTIAISGEEPTPGLH
jgi:hypothetical protein